MIAKCVRNPGIPDLHVRKYASITLSHFQFEYCLSLVGVLVYVSPLAPARVPNPWAVPGEACEALVAGDVKVRAARNLAL